MSQTITPQTSLSDDERALLSADDTRRAAMMRGDTRTLDSILAPALQHVHANGRVQNKPDYLAAIAAHPAAYQRIDRRDAVATVRGDAGWISAIQELVIERDGKRNEFTARSLSVWIRDSGRWRMAAFSTTRIVPS